MTNKLCPPMSYNNRSMKGTMTNPFPPDGKQRCCSGLTIAPAKSEIIGNDARGYQITRGTLDIQSKEYKK
jgi:hypothetical protein